MKTIISALLLTITFFATQKEASAQFAIGASYEIRDEMPENGFGLRVEKGLLPNMPVLDLNLRGHFSYFNETNSLSMEGVSFSRDVDVYDFGLAAVIGVNIGIVKPFVGAGIGRDRFKQSTEATGLSYKEANFYWNAFGGAEVSILPFINPFLEYRISRFTSTDQLTFDNVNRIAIGLNFRF